MIHRSCKRFDLIGATFAGCPAAGGLIWCQSHGLWKNTNRIISLVVLRQGSTAWTYLKPARPSRNCPRLLDEGVNR